MNRVTCLIVFIIALLAVTYATGGEPRPLYGPDATWEPGDVPDDGEPIPRGGGFLGEPPSFLVLVKVSGSPLGAWVGSGTFISNRLILTCNHNVRGLKSGKHVSIQTTDGTVYRDVSIEQTAPGIDLALLKVRDKDLQYHRVIDIQDTYAMTPHVASAGYDPTVPGMSLYQGKTNGRLFGNTGQAGPVYRGHTARVVQGMSGGPLIDQELSLIGVNVSSGDAVGGSLAVRCELIQAFLDQYNGPYEDGDTGTE